jgi:endonuclease/exonuclease/phosphatase family metal-dependent hydrolase
LVEWCTVLTSTIWRRGQIAALATAIVLAAAPTVAPTAAAAAAAPRATPYAASPAAAPATVSGLQARKRRLVSARFKLATFNILGSQHTRGSRRYASGTSRARTTARMVLSHGAGVVAFQEVQKDQLAVLREELDGYGIWPRENIRGQGVRLQIAWRTQRFKLVQAGFIRTTFDHLRRPVPWVQLRDRRSGARFYVVDIHNSPRDQERARDRATRKELALVRRLREVGRPVFVMGDTNERTEFFCRAARWADLRAANGGASDRTGCRPPDTPILDWIFADGLVEWRGYAQVRNRRVRRASDHHLVLAKVEVARWA